MIGPIIGGNGMNDVPQWMIQEATEAEDLFVTVVDEEVQRSLKLAEHTRYAVVDADTGLVRLHAKGRRALADGLQALGLMADDVRTTDQLEQVIVRCKQAMQESLIDAIRVQGRRLR